MAEKKRILIVNNFITGGGVEKLMYDLVMHWRDKYDISVLTYEYCKDFKDVYPDDVHYISASVKKEYHGNIIERVYNKFKTKIFGKIFWKTFRYRKFDVIIAIKDGWIMKDVEKFHNAPVKYAWIHTDYNNYHYTSEFFDEPKDELECMKTYNGIVCVAQTIKNSIIDVVGDPGNLIVKYNPIDIDLITEKSKESVLDAEVVREDDVTRFVTVGRLNHQKGYDLLLEACHMLEEDGLKFEVWVIGAEEPWGDEHNRLYRAQKRMNVKSVKFMGGRSNPYKYMKCADWFLSTSIFEGYSLVSQEAAVLDVPLILTDCSGVRELIGESEYGIVMGISVLDIYKGMKRVIEHPELHEYYKQKIIERKKIISFDDRIREIEELLD